MFLVQMFWLSTLLTIVTKRVNYIKVNEKCYLKLFVLIYFTFVITGGLLIDIKVLIALVLINMVIGRREQYSNSLIISLLVIIIVMVAEMICLLVYVKLFNYNTTILVQDPISTNIVNASFLIVGYILASIVRSSNRKGLKFIQLKEKYMYGFIGLLIYTIVILYINGMIFFESGTGIRKFPLGLNFVLFCFQGIVVGYFARNYIAIIRKEINMEYKEKEYDYLNVYMGNLEKLNEEMNKFKHDYINILSSITAYIEEDNIEDLRSFFYNNILPTGEGIRDTCSKNRDIKNIKILEIKGLILAKISKAEMAGVDISIDVMEAIDKINIDLLDCCRILGILLDNAIEAAIEEEDGYVKFAIIRKKRSIIFVVINKYQNQKIQIYEMFKDGVSTKGNGRGFGLSSLEDIIKRSNNIYQDTSIQDREFVQVIEIYNN